MKEVDIELVSFQGLANLARAPILEAGLWQTMQVEQGSHQHLNEVRKCRRLGTEAVFA